MTLVEGTELHNKLSSYKSLDFDLFYCEKILKHHLCTQIQFNRAQARKKNKKKLHNAEPRHNQTDTPNNKQKRQFIHVKVFWIKQMNERMNNNNDDEDDDDDEEKELAKNLTNLIISCWLNGCCAVNSHIHRNWCAKEKGWRASCVHKKGKSKIDFR